MLDQAPPIVAGALETYLISHIPHILAALGAFISAHIGSFIMGFLSIRDRLTRIETKLDAHEKDLDGLGLFLGTERAKAQLLVEANKLKA